MVRAYDFEEMLGPIRRASIEDLREAIPHLELIPELGIKSYCEFGVRQGDRFIHTVEYLTRLRELFFGSRDEFWYADAIGTKDSSKLRAYCDYNPKCRFLLTDGDPIIIHDFIHRRLDYDLAVIDKTTVDHEIVSSRAKVVRRLF